MKILLINEIRNYFLSDKAKSPQDEYFKHLVNKVMALKTKESIDYSDFASRKKTIIINCFESFFRTGDYDKRNLEIEKAIDIIDEIGED